MAYLDIWIYNSRNRGKVFLCYLLIFIAFFIFSDVMIYLYNKSLYKPLENYTIQASNLQVTISQIEASNVNGNIKGTVKNTTDEILRDKYLKFEFYTPRDVNVGVKYLEVGEIDPSVEKSYELGFRFENVSSVRVSVLEKEEAKNATPEELEITPVFGPAGLISMIILGHFFL